jgi:alkaline phosphatase D
MLTRRGFGSLLLASAASSRTLAQGPAVLPSEGDRPRITHGVSSGDVGEESAVVWSRADRPSRMIVEYTMTDSFRDARRVVGPAALPEDDFTARVVLTGLPPGQQVVYRVTFQDLTNPSLSSSIPAQGRFRTPPGETGDVTFAFGGDTAGQGYGIDVSRGGMKIYESIRQARPDFFLHSGDNIYADNPIPPEIKLDDGSIWRNLVTEETSKVAETLAEFRGRYRYNLLDANVRRFNAEVPILAQWDDHEVRNNWFPGQLIDDSRYTVKSVNLLAARGRRAFLEYMPIRPQGEDLERIYRSVRYGPTLEVFLLDQRTYRGANSANRQPGAGQDSAFLGEQQASWLARSLKESTATWKVIASDMPIGLVVRDGPTAFEALANADNGQPLGRERETADLLRTLKQAGVHNVVWLTADVHYAAAHHYDPARARFTEFDPFWEFVAGPLHAGTFGPGDLDATFGPEVKFCAIPKGMKGNRPPSEGYQFFGLIKIDGRTKVMTVALKNIEGKTLYSIDLAPVV